MTPLSFKLRLWLPSYSSRLETNEGLKGTAARYRIGISWRGYEFQMLTPWRYSEYA